MSNYYEYNFIPPHRIYARVQEELRSYFNTGAVDTLLFPVWVEDCIQKFRRTFFPIKPITLCLKDGKAKLPKDFKAVREAWGCSVHKLPSYSLGGAYYYPAEYELVTVSDGAVDSYSLNIQTDTYNITRKATGEIVHSYSLYKMLQPGHIEQECPVMPGNCEHIYDIHNGYFVTELGDQTVHLLYYTDGKGEDGHQMIPDDFFIKDYIMKYLKYQVMLSVYNTTTDETFNQVSKKLQEADQAQAAAFIAADTESKKHTLQQKVKRIKKSYNRNNRYNIR